MSKNKKITRKAFILKASKVACGYILLPITVSSLSNCDAIVKSEDCNSLDIYSECPCHGARFNIEGEVIKQPYIGSANSPLKKYISIFSGEALTIVDPDDEQSSFILNTEDFPELFNVGGYVDLEANDIDGTGFLIYRKSDKDFTVLSRECTHAGCPIDPFTSPSTRLNETGC